MRRLLLCTALAASVTTASAQAADISTSVRFGGYVTGAPHEHTRGIAFIRTPAQWPRTTPNRSTHATFRPIPVAQGCTATARVFPRSAAARGTARGLAKRDVAPADTVRRGGLHQNSWRVGASAAGVESPMRVFAVHWTQIAPHRFVGIGLNVLFAQGCPTTAINDKTLLDDVARVMATPRIKVRIVRPAKASAIPAGGIPVSPGFSKVSGPLGVGLVKPPATMSGCPERIQIGAHNTSASRAHHVYGVRAFRVRPDGTHPFRINRVLFNEERNASLRGWQYGTLRGTCQDFGVLYRILVHRPGHAREVVTKLYRVHVTP